MEFGGEISMGVWERIQSRETSTYASDLGDRVVDCTIS